MILDDSAPGSLDQVGQQAAGEPAQASGKQSAGRATRGKRAASPAVPLASSTTHPTTLTKTAPDHSGHGAGDGATDGSASAAGEAAGSARAAGPAGRRRGARASAAEAVEATLAEAPAAAEPAAAKRSAAKPTEIEQPASAASAGPLGSGTASTAAAVPAPPADADASALSREGGAERAGASATTPCADGASGARQASNGGQAGGKGQKANGVAPAVDQSLIDSATIERAEAILNHRFQDKALLMRALTHASIAPTRHQSNERLEFLGDAVLGMVVCEYLYQNYPDLLEGDMTKIKSDAVSRKKCARLATRLGLDELLLIGKGMQTRSSLPSSLSAAVVESLLGALYVEAGIDRVRAFLLPLIGPMIDDIAESGHHQNFKSVLQQHAQQVLGVQPVYHLLQESGPDHDKSFNVAVEVKGTRYEACWSRSKKQAEQAAAERALIAMGVLVEDGRKLRLNQPADPGSPLQQAPTPPQPSQPPQTLPPPSA
jgi:ribonuclease-3